MGRKKGKKLQQQGNADSDKTEEAPECSSGGGGDPKQKQPQQPEEQQTRQPKEQQHQQLKEEQLEQPKEQQPQGTEEQPFQLSKKKKKSKQQAQQPEQKQAQQPAQKKAQQPAHKQAQQPPHKQAQQPPQKQGPQPACKQVKPPAQQPSQQPVQQQPQPSAWGRGQTQQYQQLQQEATGPDLQQQAGGQAPPFRQQQLEQYPSPRQLQQEVSGRGQQQAWGRGQSLAQQQPKQYPSPQQPQQEARGLGPQSRRQSEQYPPPQRPQHEASGRGQQQQQAEGPGTPRRQQQPEQHRSPRQPQQQARGSPDQQSQEQQRRAEVVPYRSGPIVSTPPTVGDMEVRISQVRLRSGGDKAVIDPGTKGRKIQVETNHLPLLLGNLETAIHYDVEINPDTPKKLLRQVMEQCREVYYPKRYPAFDGNKNLYAAGCLLPFGESMSGEVTITEDGREKNYKINIKVAKIIDLTVLRDTQNPLAVLQNAIQCVDIVLRNAPIKSCIPVGRSFFTKPPGPTIKLGNGMELYYGFYQTAIRGWKKTFLNVDVAHKGFPIAQPVFDAVLDILETFHHKPDERTFEGELRRDDEVKVDKFLKGLKVSFEIKDRPGTRRVYKVNGLGTPAQNAMFENNGRLISVAEYFRTEKCYTLRYPKFHTLWVGKADRKDKVLIPTELCTIMPHQAVNKRLSDDQTRELIKKAAVSTDERKKKIMTSLEYSQYNLSPTVQEFGFQVGTDFEKIPARVLTPPVLEYADKTTVAVSKGVWQNNKKFFKPANISGKWTIICVDFRAPLDKDYHNFVTQVQQYCRSLGMDISKPIQPFQHIKRISVEILKEFFKKGSFDIVFVIIPSANNSREYSIVKSAAELKVGCVTQCIKARTLQRMNASTVGNILLKVNSKLNGINHILSVTPSLLRQPCVIMGADVTHPPPDSKNIPSVAAVTGSLDSKGFRYKYYWRLQPSKVEIIEDLAAIIKEHLLFFYTLCRVKPEKIIFFRDGVSEGQFDQVVAEELKAIQKACKELQKEDYEPKITFLVVQKRHHTRLFPTNKRDSEDRNFNVPAGTCVDTEITNPTLQDFYLVSHASIQGVAKPTKYCTLYDDNDLSHDEIEEFTYYLCHMFSRCNRSVSYPAPTYYAHLAAARAKVYIENTNLDLNELKNEQKRFEIQRSLEQKWPMFFV